MHANRRVGREKDLARVNEREKRERRIFENVEIQQVFTKHLTIWRVKKKVNVCVVILNILNIASPAAELRSVWP